MLNRRVLVFVITFFQLFIAPEVVEVTKMTGSNLGTSPSFPFAIRVLQLITIVALVLAPNLLRTTSDSLVTVFTNSSFESRFVLHLLNHLVPSDVDPEYTPAHGQISL